MICLVSGAIVLSWTGQPTLSGILGPASIVGACLAWGLDNNLTRKVSLADPLQIVELKGLVAGPINLAIGFYVGGHLPSPTSLALAGVVGFLGYGVSLALFVFSLRDLGTARTGAYFSTAPFLGALGSIVFLGEPFTAPFVAAGVLMATGVLLHLTEEHEHRHEHRRMTHTHAHEHDSHHQHTHDESDPAGEVHSHEHTHEDLVHTHAHVPDMHHTIDTRHYQRPALLVSVRAAEAAVCGWFLQISGRRQMGRSKPVPPPGNGIFAARDTG